MSNDALDDHVSRWRDARAQRIVAWRFLDRRERTCLGALAALEQEWLNVMREVREREVAAVKLGWWREEMQRAVCGDARHPLTVALFAEPRARAVAPALWSAPVDAAFAALAAPPPADFASQCTSARPLARALAELETCVWFGKGDTRRATDVALLGHLASDLRALPALVAIGRSPLPMNLLARHGLTVEDLANDGPARRAALRDQVADLRRALAGTATMSGPLGLFRAVDMQHDLSTFERAGRADDPLPALRASVHGLGSLLKTWRAARTCRGVARSESRE